MSLPAEEHSAHHAAAPGYVRVLVVDDSAVIRGIITRWLEDQQNIRVIASAANGSTALRCVKSTEFDLVILDIEMPEMDGLTALPQLLAAQPGLQIIMASTLTMRNADISLRALSLGAADYIPKPQSTRLVTAGQDFRQELIQKVLALGNVARQRRNQPPVDIQVPAPAAAPIAKPVATSGEGAPKLSRIINRSQPVRLAPRSHVTPGIVAIGSSTGGPQALFTVIGALGKLIGVPVVITQHMPPTFTAILAQHIERVCGVPCIEVTSNQKALPGRVYVAPGDRHMLIGGTAHVPELLLSDGEPENFCRPAVDPMFRTASEVFGGGLLAVVLTGMGQDGAAGAEQVIARGGTVIAQDEATSVVWGMPGAVAHVGAASMILPLPDIGQRIRALVEGKQV